MTEFLIIVESEADFRTASEIANRIFMEQIEWIEPYLSELLQWRGLSPNANFSCWKDIKSIHDEMRSQGIRLPRVLGGPDRMLKTDGASARKALHMVSQLQKDKTRNIKALVFIRDLDNQPQRRQALEQARQAYSSIVYSGPQCQDQTSTKIRTQGT